MLEMRFDKSCSTCDLAIYKHSMNLIEMFHTTAKNIRILSNGTGPRIILMELNRSHYTSRIRISISSFDSTHYFHYVFSTVIYIF